MTATSLNLNGQPIKFLGAYVKNISQNLGLSTAPTTVTVTLVEDDDAIFIPPEMGSFHRISAGDNWTFGGIIIKYDLDLSNISGRTIRVNMSDPREIMKSAPTILAPGSEAISATIKNTGCSVLDIYGAYGNTGINLSGWNQAGMEFQRIISALKGDSILFGATVIPIEQQLIKAFGEIYAFNIDEVGNRVDINHRVNTNLTPLSNIIEDLSARNAYDWFIESEKGLNGIIQVTVKVIDRSVDNIDIGLQDFLDLHEDRVITATSGVELRNDIACLALQGASVENMVKVSILGLANEPLDLSLEDGTNAYFMEEEEMRSVISGRNQWEIWLEEQREYLAVSTTVFSKDSNGNTIETKTTTTSFGGFSRYGNQLQDDFVQASVIFTRLKDVAGKNLPIPKRRSEYIKNLTQRELVGKIFTKLESHAKASYGKKFVHDDVGGEIIQSAWTRDVVGGNDDPNEYFRQEDGRTRAYVEFSTEDAGGAFSLGLTNLTNLFGDQNIFRNITRFGTTFENRTTGVAATLPLSLKNVFNPNNVNVEISDTANYVYKEADTLTSTLKTSLYVACTVSKDGTISLPGGIFQSIPTPQGVRDQAIENKRRGTRNDEATLSPTEEDDAYRKIKRWWGTNVFDLHARAFQPTFLYVPTRSRTLRYGPVFSAGLSSSSQGKLQILQDDGFSPWEFGGISLMISAMQLKVNNATSLQKEAFSAAIQVEGYPLFNAGASIEKNSNINSITMSFGDGGVKTSYGLQTYTRKFGELSKEDWARIAFILNNGGGRVLPQQQSNFITQYNVNVDKNFTGRFDSSSSNITGGALDFG